MQLVKPKKSLGQHFLTDLSIAEGIADTLATHRDLPVLEVGPGAACQDHVILLLGILHATPPPTTARKLPPSFSSFLSSSYSPPLHKEVM